MADNEETQEEEKKSGGFVVKLVVWLVIFVLGAGSGAAVPLFLLPQKTAEARPSPYPSLPTMDIPEAGEETVFIDFDEVAANLNDSRYSRFVACTFSVQVAKTQQMAIEKIIEEKQVVLINWLIAHLREKKLEDVRGKLGHNTMRREIHDKFNEILFEDGIERIQDVYFKDFKVQ